MYWRIGHSILTRQEAEGWGTRVIDRLCADLRQAFPTMRGLSQRNLVYMRTFAAAWPDQIAQQPVARLPCGHVTVLLDKFDDPTERDFYAAAAVQYGWSRDVLLNQIMNRLHTRAGAAPSNFPAQLPAADSELAQQLPEHLGQASSVLTVSRGTAEALAGASQRMTRYRFCVSQYTWLRAIAVAVAATAALTACATTAVDDDGQAIPTASREFHDYVGQYATYGVTTDAQGWNAIAANSCLAARLGDTDRWLPTTAEGLDEDLWWDIADHVFAAAISFECPAVEYTPTATETAAFAHVDQGIAITPPERQRALDDPAGAPPASTWPVPPDSATAETELSEYERYMATLREQYRREIEENVGDPPSGLPGGYQGPTSTGNGYRVMCSDGTFSNAGGRQGACSHHGGVAG